MMLFGVVSTPSEQPTNGCGYMTGNAMEEKILQALKALGGSAKPAELVKKLRGKAKDYMLTDWLFWDFYPALRELVNNGRVIETRDAHDAATLHLVEGNDA